MLYCYLYALTYVCHNEELNMFTSSSLIKQNNKTLNIDNRPLGDMEKFILCFCFLYINIDNRPDYAYTYVMYLPV